MTKRVNILLREVKDEAGNIKQRGNVILRVSARLAANQVAKGYAVYTSKQKLKSIMKRQQTIENNLKWLKAKDYRLQGSKIVNKYGELDDIYKDPTNGKVHVYLKSISKKGYLTTRLMNLGFENRVMPVEF